MKSIKEKMIEWFRGEPARFFSSRSAFAAAVSVGQDWPIGTVVFAGGCAYLFDGTSDKLPSIYGWRPNSSASLMHYGDDFSQDTVDAMSSDVGFVFIDRVVNVDSDVDVLAPLIFSPSGMIVNNSEYILKVCGPIVAGRWRVFDGNGQIRIWISGRYGEDAKVVSAHWFGVSPTNTTNIDLSPRINWMMSAFDGQTREGVVDFDSGSYHVASGFTVPRGVWLRGSGRNRTTFDVSGAGYSVITTGGDYCKITGIQFEQPSAPTYRAGELITVNHAGAILDDVRLWSSHTGLVVNGANCCCTNISATYGAVHEDGSSTILVNAQGFSLDGLVVSGTAEGPDVLVRIKSDASGIGNINVDNLVCGTKAIPVSIEPSVNTVTGVNISNVTWSGSGSIETDALVRIKTTGSGNVNNINAVNLNANSLAKSLLKIEQGSSGITERVNLSNANIQGANASGSGIDLTRTAGTLRNVTIGDTVNIKDRDVPVKQSGTMTNIRVSPLATKGANSSYCYAGNIPDDGVMIIPLGRQVFTSSCILTSSSNINAIFYARIASSPALAAIGTPLNVVLNASLGVLNGTTGADGDMTVSCTTDAIYIENRRGSQLPVNIAIMAGT